MFDDVQNDELGDLEKAFTLRIYKDTKISAKPSLSGGLETFSENH